MLGMRFKPFIVAYQSWILPSNLERSTLPHSLMVAIGDLPSSITSESKIILEAMIEQPTRYPWTLALL